MNTVTAEDVLLMVPDLRRYARQLAGDVSAADDLLQDTLLRTLSRLDQYKPTGSFKGWVFTIMKNQFLDERRRQKFRRAASFDEDTHAGARTVNPSQVDSLVLKELRGALTRLPEQSRTLLLGVVLHGWSYEDAAERMGLPLGTVRSRLFRARAALLAQLDPVAGPEARSLLA